MIPILAGDMFDLEEAWKFFIWLEAVDWKHLPKAGGLEDQDELLMDNLFAITAFIRKIQKKAQEG